MRRGDIYLVELEPVRPGEMGKKRPCLLISADQYNLRVNNVIVMPITSYPPNDQSVGIRADGRSGLDRDSSVRPLQIRAVVKSRLIHRLGYAPKEVVDEALAILNHVIEPGRG